MHTCMLTCCLPALAYSIVTQHAPRTSRSCHPAHLCTPLLHEYMNLLPIQLPHGHTSTHTHADHCVCVHTRACLFVRSPTLLPHSAHSLAPSCPPPLCTSLLHKHTARAPMQTAACARSRVVVACILCACHDGQWVAHWGLPMAATPIGVGMAVGAHVGGALVGFGGRGRQALRLGVTPIGMGGTNGRWAVTPIGMR